jgi:hypothetical protein
MNATTHNGCKFEIVRYFDNKAVIKVSSINGGYLEGADEETPNQFFRTESIENLTTNFGGGFEDWVKDNY